MTPWTTSTFASSSKHNHVCSRILSALRQHLIQFAQEREIQDIERRTLPGDRNKPTGFLARDAHGFVTPRFRERTVSNIARKRDPFHRPGLEGLQVKMGQSKFDKRCRST